MFYSGSTNLKFSKKRNQWENGGQHNCVIDVNENEKDYVKGWSYSQIIFYYDNELNKWIFNDYKFSVTTTSHQYELWSRLKGIASENDIIVTRSYSINDGFKYEKLENTELNIDLVTKYFPKKLENFKNTLKENEIQAKKYKSQNAMRKKVDRLDYATKENLLKALEKCERKLKDINIRDVWHSEKCLSIGFSTNEITSQFNFEIRELCLKEIVLVMQNEELSKIYNLDELNKYKKLNFRLNLYDSSSDESYIQELDKLNILDKVIESTFRDNTNLDEYTLGRAILNHKAKKSLTDITGA